MSSQDRIIIYMLLRFLAFTNFVLLLSAYTTYCAFCNISDRLLDINDLLIEIKEAAADRLLVQPIHQVILIQPVQQVQQVPVQAPAHPPIQAQLQVQGLPQLRRGIIRSSHQ